ncbi:Ig-like domain-containing protein [Vibrio owensii]|uniref:Ig-like domain-containing protein n=1 Tax=Vibrio owensii TaxID=696485 RepID=UPI0040694893
MLKVLKFCSASCLLLTFLISGCNDKGKDTTESVVHESYNDIKFASVLPQKKVNVMRLLENQGIISPSNIQLIYGDNLQCDLIKDTNGGAEIYLAKDSWCILSYDNDDGVSEKGILSLVSNSQSEHNSYAKVTSMTETSENSEILIKPENTLSALNAIPKGFVAKDSSFLIVNNKKIREISYDYEKKGYMFPHESSSSFKMIYAYSDIEGDLIQGLIVGAFSSSANAIPIASKRKVTVPVGSDVVIDMKDFVSDSDGDRLQIIEVIDNNGNVEPFDKNDIYNLKLKANFKQEGYVDVAYVISDHKGAIASNIISFTVKGSSEGLENIFDETGEGVFTFPENVDIATNSGHTGFLATSIEDGTTGIDGIEYPIYDEKKGSAVCTLKGKKLPNRSEMKGLWNKEGNLYVTNHWPVGHKYIGVDSLGPFQFDMSTGILEEVTNPAGYVTCYGYSYDTINISEKWLVVDKSRQLHVVASYKGNIIPSIPPVISWEVDDESIATIDSSGLLTSLGKEGVVRVTAMTIDGILGVKDIRIVRNLFEDYKPQDPAFDKSADAAGLTYAHSCLDDENKFKEFTGIQCSRQTVGGSYSKHNCASLCTVSSELAPSSGQGFTKTFGWIGGATNDSVAVATATPFFERFEEEANYVLSFSMNLNDWLTNESFKRVKGTKVLVVIDGTSGSMPPTTRFLFYLTRNFYSDSTTGVIFDISKEPEVAVGSDNGEFQDWDFDFDSNTGWLNFDFSFLLKGKLMATDLDRRKYKVTFYMYPNTKNGGGCFDTAGMCDFDDGEFVYYTDELILFPGAL